MKTSLRVLVAMAHPDDVEFMAAGTALMLKKAGTEVHMWNLTNGCLGSLTHTREETSRLRWQEAQDSARLAGAIIHPPLFDDLAIFYDQSSLALVAAVIRDIKPTIILTQPPTDYMEDHQNACRLIVSAAFARVIPHFVTSPQRPPYDGPVAIYHALPHGLTDPLRTPVYPHLFIDIESVLAVKREMLAQHRSQKAWLDATQGMDSYLHEMERLSAAVGAMSGRYHYAEGWRQHAPHGFASAGFDPLSDILADYVCKNSGAKPSYPQ